LIADADSGGAQLRLAHEALLTHWPRVHDHVAAEAHDLELRGRLEQGAEGWRAAPPREKTDHVAAGLLLAQGRALVAKWGDELPIAVREFVTASRRAARRRLRSRIAIVAGALIAMPAIAAVVWAGMVWWGVRAVEAEMRFISVKAGCFDMGSPDTEVGRFQNEGPVHHVCLDAFELGQFEVTQDEWRPVMVFVNSAPSFFKGDGRRPVESVSWNEAQSFIRLMSLFGKYRYRLPNEAEWEYAARGGTTTSRFWGERAEAGCRFENMADLTLKQALPDAVVADCDDGYATTAPVGSFEPNPFGFHDMLGNVAEWAEDCYADYAKPPEIPADCATRSVRGGSWNIDPRFLRAADRSGISPNVRSGYIGLRLAR
jgi:formylglycine-generating enzyme required for sulfatase activity